MSQKLSRREMKRNEFTEGVSSIAEYIAAHSRTVLSSVVGVLLVAAGAIVIWSLARAREERANELFAQALRVATATIDEASPSPDAFHPVFGDEAERDERSWALFEEVIEKYGGTQPGKAARLFLAKRDLANGDLEAARQAWQNFVGEQRQHALRAEIELNLVRLDSAQGRHQEATERLRGMLRSPGALPEALLLGELAASLERLGEEDEARATYQRILDDHPTAPAAGRARQKLGALASSSPNALGS